MRVRDADLFVNVVGSGPPLLLMHGGPGLDQWSLVPFRHLADRFTLIFYDHRCNGRSASVPVSSMTWDNLTADADALREQLGFERWAVLGHSFGGTVALEYALRYPERLSHLILVDTGGDGRWPREHAPGIVRRRGYGRRTTNAVRRIFNGRFEPEEWMSLMIRFLLVYYRRRGLSLLRVLARDMLAGEWRAQTRPEALRFAARHLYPDWSVMERLGEITAPTLVMGGRDDFLYPPEHQAQLAAGIPNARLHIVERAGHNPFSEEPDDVLPAVADFLVGAAAPGGARPVPELALAASR